MSDENTDPVSINDSNSEPTTKSDSLKGKAVICVIIAGAAWVGLAPFIGEWLAKDKHLQTTGKAPEPLAVDQKVPEGYQNLALQGKSFKMPTDVAQTGQAQASPGLAGKQTSAAQISERFQNGISATTNTNATTNANSSASDTTGSTKVDQDNIDAVTNAAQSSFKKGDDEQVIRLADRALVLIAKSTATLAGYKTINAALAMRSSYRLNRPKEGQKYADLALATARANNDDMAGIVETYYYPAIGINTDFARLRQVIAQFENESNNGKSENLLNLADQMMTLTAPLPATSFYRLKARCDKGTAQLLKDQNAAAARKTFEEIKKDADSVKDTGIANAAARTIEATNKH